MRPLYGRLLEFKKSKRRFLKMYDAKMSYACCPGPSSAISAQFALEMCVAAGSRKKITKNPYFRGSRSFKVIDVNTNKNLSLLFVVISSMSVPICNRFHATRDNCGKITTFQEG